MTFEKLIELLDDEFPTDEFSVGFIGNSRMGNVYRARFRLLHEDGVRTLFSRSAEELYSNVKKELEENRLTIKDIER